MSNSLNILLRCDRRITPPGEDKARRCRQMYIGPPSNDIAAVRELAAAAGWTWKPAKPYPHVGAQDFCPEHTP